MGRTVYGVAFESQLLNSKNMLLRPRYLISGEMTKEGNIIEGDDVYKRISNSFVGEDYTNLYGFGIEREELYNFFTAIGMTFDEFNVQASKYYIEFAKKFIFMVDIDKHAEKPVCYAINLYTKESTKVDINKNIILQLRKSYIDGLNKEKKTISSPISQAKIITTYNPKKLLDKVKERVIGQDAAAEALVSTVCKNLKYYRYEGMKSNILLYGPTGCGKTELVRSLSKEMKLPLVIEDCSNYTANGYVGDSVKSILRKLYVASGEDMELAQRGIVFLDEFDKLASTSSDKSVNKTEVQEELLKIVEGVKINLNDSNRTNEQLIMDTSNITFVLGGAFTELRKNKNKKVIGFGAKPEEVVEEISNEDFQKYGIIPEMVGRISVKVPIRQLDTKDLEEVLTRSSISCLKIYETALLKEDKIKIVYENDKEFISKVASDASDLDIGARGLKTIVDNIFLPIVSKIGEDEKSYERELIISSETVNEPKAYVLRKVKKNNDELQERIRERNR